MGYDIRLPNINAPTEKGQLVQLKSYIYQLAEQLQYALNNIDSSTASGYVVNEAMNSTTQDATQKIDEQATFNAVKALIIKSAEIVDAYYDEISRRLEGEYVAISDFGTYSEQTEQVIKENSTNIESLFSSRQKIEAELGIDLEHYLTNVDAHIIAGKIDEVNGVPIYGLEIGQKNTKDGKEDFHKYARFTSDRLSFFDQNDIEVAYVSDKNLHIKGVEVLSTFKIGGFEDIVQSTGDIVTKWVGKGGDG